MFKKDLMIKVKVSANLQAIVLELKTVCRPGGKVQRAGRIWRGFEIKSMDLRKRSDCLKMPSHHSTIHAALFRFTWCDSGFWIPARYAQLYGLSAPCCLAVDHLDHRLRLADMPDEMLPAHYDIFVGLMNGVRIPSLILPAHVHDSICEKSVPTSAYCHSA